MSNNISQIAEEFIRLIEEKISSPNIKDIDALGAELLEDCKETARKLLREQIDHMNQKIRKDKAWRKEHKLLVKEHDIPRKILIPIGEFEYCRDYYELKGGGYKYPLDEMISVRSYERIGDSINAEMTTRATRTSYAYSAAETTGGLVSRQTVRNKILKIGPLEHRTDVSEKRKVKELHVYADEDHVHMQRPNKKKGKKSKMVPLVTVTEGMYEECRGRRRTINPKHFVDKDFDTERLWKSVEGYILETYDLEELDSIYVHGDGATWITKGLNVFPQTKHIMDGYHLNKYLKDLSIAFPEQNIRYRLRQSIANNDRKKADLILNDLVRKCDSKKKYDKVRIFGTYLFNHWEKIVRRMTEDVPGSCTEALVSHVLSDRFSRDPLGWSEEGLGVLSSLRVYVTNGGKITSKDFKSNEMKESYSEYVDKMIEESICGTLDWSIFEPEQYVFDQASGTQQAVRHIGSYKDMLN